MNNQSEKNEKKKEKKRKQREEIESLVWTADWPANIFNSYLKQVYNQFKKTTDNDTTDSRIRYPGLTEMCQVIGLSTDTVRYILDGRNTRVPLDICDKVCMHGDFSLEDIHTEVIRWARDNPKEEWPKKYKPKACHGRNTKIENKH